MAKHKTAIAKLFPNGGSQAVRLPQQFRFEGSEVNVERVPGGVLLTSRNKRGAKEWFATLDQFNAEAFMEKFGKVIRRQPRAPSRKIFS